MPTRKRRAYEFFCDRGGGETFAGAHFSRWKKGFGIVRGSLVSRKNYRKSRFFLENRRFQFSWKPTIFRGPGKGGGLVFLSKNVVFFRDLQGIDAKLYSGHIGCGPDTSMIPYGRFIVKNHACANYSGTPSVDAVLFFPECGGRCVCGYKEKTVARRNGGTPKPVCTWWRNKMENTTANYEMTALFFTNIKNRSAKKNFGIVRHYGFYGGNFFSPSGHRWDNPVSLLRKGTFKLRNHIAQILPVRPNIWGENEK